MRVTKNEIKFFENPKFGKIRIVKVNKEVLFCLIDLCSVLGLNPSKVSQRLDKDVLSKYPLLTEGGEQIANFVNEDGLYDVILESRKPEARQFRKWITSEVLPSIRKTGQYSNESLMQSKLDKRDEIIAFLKEDNERLFDMIKSMREEIKIQNNGVKLIFD
ncbi:hypothetical protein EZS27_040105, partial [termite gut metagenome]